MMCVTPIDADLDPRTNYATLDAEMIARCPHWEKNTDGVDIRPPYYESDNAKLWTILFEIFRDHASYTYMHPFEEALTCTHLKKHRMEGVPSTSPCEVISWARAILRPWHRKLSVNLNASDTMAKHEPLTSRCM
jgi:hypothetical protein